MVTDNLRRTNYTTCFYCAVINSVLLFLVSRHSWSARFARMESNPSFCMSVEKYRCNVDKRRPTKYRRYRDRYFYTKVSSISISIHQKYRRTTSISIFDINNPDRTDQNLEISHNLPPDSWPVCLTGAKKVIWGAIPPSPCLLPPLQNRGADMLPCVCFKANIITMPWWKRPVHNHVLQYTFNNNKRAGWA